MIKLYAISWQAAKKKPAAKEKKKSGGGTDFTENVMAVCVIKFN